jgi:hypothetical protein
MTWYKIPPMASSLTAKLLHLQSLCYSRKAHSLFGYGAKPDPRINVKGHDLITT